MNILLAISCALYAALLMTALVGIYRLRSKRKTKPHFAGNKQMISVVIPFRNERENLPKLIADLREQQSDGPFEVIGIDDHSDDNSLAVFRECTADLPNFQVFSLTADQGKKNALSLGIERASGDFIATLDADVRVPAKWLKTLRQELGSEDSPDMLILPVKLSGNQNDARAFFQMSENLAIQGLGFGLAAFNRPISCNGANLAFRKSAYTECSGYHNHKDTASGDDVFLMQQMVKNGMRVLPVFDENVVVKVSPAQTWREMLNQRLRWAGKTGRMNLGGSILSGGILLFFALTILIAVLLPNRNWAFWSVVVLIKVIVDVVLIKTVERTYNQRLNPLKLGLVAMFYVVYLPLISLLSIWWKPKWKGRQI